MGSRHDDVTPSRQGQERTVCHARAQAAEKPCVRACAGGGKGDEGWQGDESSDGAGSAHAACKASARRRVRKITSVATRPQAAANISHRPGAALLPVLWIR